MYETALVHPVVNCKNRVLLQLLYVRYFHFAEEIDYMLSLAHAYIDSQYTQLFFSLSLQHNDFAHLFPLFDIVVFL